MKWSAQLGQRLALPLPLLLYGLLAFIFVLRTPAWQAPDEPAHWNYIAAITQQGCCPRLESGDWNSDLLAELTSNRFQDASAEQLARLRYENHHPPLYYALATAIFRWSSGNITVLRLWSVFLGLGIVANAFRCGRTIAPKKPAIAALTALFSACLPQQVHILASINNDALAWLLISQTTYVSLRYLRGLPLLREGQIVSAIMLLGGAYLLLSGGETRGIGLAILFTAAAQLWFFHRDNSHSEVWLLGALIGLIFITKTTAYLMLPVVLIGIVLHEPDKASRIRLIAWALIPALLLAATWWLRNLTVYGFPDFLGLIQHNQVVTGQLRSSTWIQERGLFPYLSNLIRVSYTSFWGQFGWMALPLNGWRLLYTFVMSAFATYGAQVALRSSPRSSSARMLLAQCLLTAAVFAFYNLAFVQWQGRYLYPALIPFALAWAWGLRSMQTTLGHWTSSLAYLLAASLPLFALEIAWQVLPGLNP